MNGLLKGDMVYVKKRNANELNGRFNTPKLIISSNDVNDNSDYLLMVPIVSGSAISGNTEFAVPVKCKQDSYVILDNISSIHKDKVDSLICTLTEGEMKPIEEMLCRVMGLSSGFNAPPSDNEVRCETVNRYDSARTDRRIIELETELRVYKEVNQNLMRSMRG